MSSAGCAKIAPVVSAAVRVHGVMTVVAVVNTLVRVLVDDALFVVGSGGGRSGGERDTEHCDGGRHHPTLHLEALSASTERFPSAGPVIYFTRFRVSRAHAPPPAKTV